MESDHKIVDFLFDLQLTIRKHATIQATEKTRHQKSDENYSPSMPKIKYTIDQNLETCSSNLQD